MAIAAATTTREKKKKRGMRKLAEKKENSELVGNPKLKEH